MDPQDPCDGTGREQDFSPPACGKAVSSVSRHLHVNLYTHEVNCRVRASREPELYGLQEGEDPSVLVDQAVSRLVDSLQVEEIDNEDTAGVLRLTSFGELLYAHTGMSQIDHSDLCTLPFPTDGDLVGIGIPPGIFELIGLCRCYGWLDSRPFENMRTMLSTQPS
jgi:hypothetical protein